MMNNEPLNTFPLGEENIILIEDYKEGEIVAKKCRLCKELIDVYADNCSCGWKR